MRIQIVFVSVFFILVGCFHVPSRAEDNGSDWVAIKEGVHSKECMELIFNEFEKSDLVLNFVFPDQASIEIWKPHRVIEPKVNQSEIKGYVDKQTKKDFLVASMLTGKEENLEEVKAFLLTLGYKRVLFQRACGIGYPSIIYDSLNHSADAKKNKQKN